MADNSLDDFFAKKDKKGKKKATDKIKKSKKKDTDGSSNPELNSAGQKIQEDVEWIDFEQEAEKDYSGLRLTNLQISNRDEEDERDTERKSDDEEGEDGDGRDSTSSGPWNKVASQTEPTPTPAPVKEVVKEEAPVRSGKYVPPGARAAKQTGSSSASRKKKQAPDIQSAMDFPTLGGPEDRDNRDFQRVSRGKQAEVIPTNQAPRLQLDNKYDVLSNTDN